MCSFITEVVITVIMFPHIFIYVYVYIYICMWLYNTRKQTNQLQFAKECKKWTAEQWKNISWSDESKFEIFSSKGKQYIRRVGESMNDVYLKPTIKYRVGSVILGCLTANGLDDLVWFLWFLWFYGISTFEGYLTPNPFLCK